MISSDLVATIIAAPGTSVTEPTIFACGEALLKEGARALRTALGYQHQTVDLFFRGIIPEKAFLVLESALTDKPSLPPVSYDCVLQKAAGRQKKLIVADMESTLIEQEMLDELAELLSLGDQVASITRRAMNGELDFEGALKSRVQLFRGQPVSLLEKAASQITYMRGAEVLLAGMKKVGAKAWLVSGGFTYFAEPVAAKLGFDRCFANELILDKGRLTGEVRLPILDKNAKARLLLEAAKTYGLNLEETLSIGDGANDISMLKASEEAGGLGVAYHAKPKVRAVVRNQLNVGSLDSLLAVQGIKPPLHSA